MTEEEKKGKKYDRREDKGVKFGSPRNMKFLR